MAFRGKWIQDPETGDLLTPQDYARLKERREAHKRSSLGAPFVIGAMAPIQSMVDGQYYDDKRSYEKSVHRAGCEVVGYDKNWTEHIPPSYNEKIHEADIVADVKKAIEIETSK